MLTALRRRWADTTQAWLLARQGRDHDRAELGRGRIYILPTAFGAVFALFLFGLLLGSMNYSNSMGFILTFLLGALYLLAMHHAHRNLLGLVVERGRTEEVFAGQYAEFTLNLVNRSAGMRWAIGADSEGETAWFTDLPAGATVQLPLPVKAPRRGLLTLPSARVYTRHPFGLFHAWAVLHMELRVIVYPHPALDAPPAPVGAEGEGRGARESRGQDDFAGLRDYRAGEPPRHIAWKAYARDEQLRSKEFAGALRASPWFEFDALDGDVEQRLSVLCRWVLDADRDGRHYGLRLPGVVIPPGSGDAHRRACLEALALYGHAA